MAKVIITLEGVTEDRVERLKTMIRTHLHRFGRSIKVDVEEPKAARIRKKLLGKK